MTKEKHLKKNPAKETSSEEKYRPNREREITSRRPAKGRVRWFDRVLNYGFIWEEGNSEDIFVHYTTVQVPGTRCLRKNQRVIFEYCTTQLGPIAQNVVPIEEKNTTSKVKKSS